MLSQEEAEKAVLEKGLSIDPVEAQLKIQLYEKAISQLFERRLYEGLIPDYILDHWFPLTKNIKQKEAG